MKRTWTIIGVSDVPKAILNEMAAEMDDFSRKR
jgi:hypothetical protein